MRTWAAGNLVSTAADVSRFWRALLGGRLLRPRQLPAMKATVPAWEGTPVRYGLGIQEVPSPCGTRWGNGGDIAGFANRFHNSGDGKRQAAVVVDANPAPEAVGEERAQTLAAAMSAALGDGKAC
jgi:D-alanyl-D-alanine carboxypeptidase